MKRLIFFILILFLSNHCLAQESVVKEKIQWEFTLCPASSFRIYKDSHFFNRTVADSVQIPKFTIAFGVNALKKVSNHFFISIGINISDKGFKSKDYIVEYDTYYYHGMLTQTNYATVNDYYNWWYIEMPVGIKYNTLPVNRIGYFGLLTVSPCLSILSSNSGVAPPLDATNNLRGFVSLWQVNGIIYSSTVSLGLSLYSDVAIWSFAPTFNYGLTTATSQLHTKTFLYSYGLTIGLSYRR